MPCVTCQKGHSETWLLSGRGKRCLQAGVCAQPKTASSNLWDLQVDSVSNKYQINIQYLRLLISFSGCTCELLIMFLPTQQNKKNWVESLGLFKVLNV